MEGKAKISKRMQFRPATTDSHTHKRLRDAIEKKHGARAKGTIRFVSNVDPEKEKDASDRLFEQRAREEAQLVTKTEENDERRYTITSRWWRRRNAEGWWERRTIRGW